MGHSGSNSRSSSFSKERGWIRDCDFRLSGTCFCSLKDSCEIRGNRNNKVLPWKWLLLSREQQPSTAVKRKTG
ncbi:hypothetical protein Y1Q_0023847 [Alligator mississippiensis]|uniref:Uncharacterized protein n=1 Tax=Alligator mississippiensis TaxID=8496 RepID=A0A151MKF6_ALLMI|nr:hypothetical protein Y1Q_0023847 [Alligator mississippiensis]